MALTKEDIQDAVSIALEEKLGQFFIEREQHYQHHKFIEAVINYSDKIKFTVCKSITNTLIGMVFFLIMAGIIFWGRHHMGSPK